MRTRQTRSPRMGLHASIATTGIGMFAISLLDESPKELDNVTAETVRAYFRDHMTGIALGAIATAAAAMLLIVLTRCLALLIEDAEPSARVASGVLQAAAAVTATTWLIGAALDALPVVKSPLSEISDAHILLFYGLRDLQESVGDLSTYPRGLLLAAAGWAILRHAVAPRWLGWYSVVIATASLISPIGLPTGIEAFGVLWLAGLFGFLVWPLLTGIAFGLRGRRATHDKTMPAPT